MERDIVEWISQNSKKRWTILLYPGKPTKFSFEEETDAILFAMRWK